MLYKLARLLQLLGLFILPFAIAGEVAGKMDLKSSLLTSGVGVACFCAGWLLQRAGRPR